MNESFVSALDRPYLNFDRFESLYRNAEAVVEERKQRMLDLAQQHRDATVQYEAGKQSMDMVVEGWWDELEGTPTLYSASFYLDESGVDGSKLDTIKRLHYRGAILAHLGMRLDEKPEPVLCLRLRQENINMDDDGRCRRGAPGVRLALLEAMVGLTTEEKPLEVKYRKEVDRSRGTVTSEPEFLALNLGQHTIVQSDLGKETHYSETTSWLNRPRVVGRERGALRLLGKAGVLGPRRTILHTEFGDAELCGQNGYDIFIGKTSVGPAIKQLSRQWRGVRSDKAALEQLIESAAPFTRDQV